MVNIIDSWAVCTSGCPLIPWPLYSVSLWAKKCYLHLLEWMDSVLSLAPSSWWKFHYCRFYFHSSIIKTLLLNQVILWTLLQWGLIGQTEFWWNCKMSSRFINTYSSICVYIYVVVGVPLHIFYCYFKKSSYFLFESRHLILMLHINLHKLICFGEKHE